MPTSISWTQETWNPVVGCSKVSEGCKNCYAIRMTNRLAHIDHSKDKYSGLVEKTAGGNVNWTGAVRIFQDDLDIPFKRKRPTMYFVNSMSDLFHESLSFRDIHRVFMAMALNPQHIFQVLTKRPERMVEYFKRYDQGIGDMHDTDEGCIEFNHMFWRDNELLPAMKKAGWYNDVGSKDEFGGRDRNFIYEGVEPLPNIWIGVSVENQKAANERIPLLLQVPAAVRFLSCEPLIERVSISEWVEQLDWVILGGESGPGARPLHPDWARSLHEECKNTSAKFFFKQWGSWLPWETSAQPPFWVSQNGQQVDGHALPEHEEMEKSAKRDDGMWCIQEDEEPCLFERVGAKEAGATLDGIGYHNFPPQIEMLLQGK